MGGRYEVYFRVRFKVVTVIFPLILTHIVTIPRSNVVRMSKVSEKRGKYKGKLIKYLKR